jgi:uncharacterized protein (DUF58 family)
MITRSDDSRATRTTDARPSTGTGGALGTGHGGKRLPLAKRVRPRERLRITREGWLFIIISIAIGLAAIRSGNNLLFLILGMMLGLLIVSGILSEMSLRGLDFSRLPPGSIHAVKPFLMGISVTNTKRYFPSFSIEVEDIQADRVLDKRCYFLKIPAGRTQTTAYRHAFARRGRYHFSGFKVSTKFPFALLRKSRLVELETDVLVLPAVRQVSLPPLPAPDTVGDRHRRLRGRGGDVYGLHDFRPGDDPREIHWKASAHRGRLVIREREAESARELVLRLDHRLVVPDGGSMLAGAEAIELAITTTASMAAHLIRLGYQVGLLTQDETLPTDEGPSHLARILRLLAQIEYADADATHPPAPEAMLVLHVSHTAQVSLVGPTGRLESAA